MKTLIVIITVLLFTEIVNAQHNTVMFGSPYQNHNCNPYCVEAHQGYGTYWDPSPNQNFGVDVSVSGNNASFGLQIQGQRRTVPPHYHTRKVYRDDYIYYNNCCYKKIQVFDHCERVLCTDRYCTNW